MALTEQKRRYAAARLSGMGKKAAAIEAGCPERTAAQAASRYEKDPDVQAAMGRQLKAAEKKVAATSVDTDPYIPARSDDPLEFMRQMMNDLEADPKLRLDAAKSLAAFTVAKPGDKGKKEERADAAKSAGKKFGATPPPGHLRAVK
ncbi:TPA: terminase small subunit [Pseudomonas aeruginosa]|uniref:terminase small subunit n=1 Tax=Pseudomonas aeruginosa TaxID=287 RepID=UPI001A2DD79B|nr:terminase small subunit [Pseudomonas aeruginosa]MBI7277215.1 terminase small subunit [Pseudomonas aeruginosa]MCY0330073.1 terminase small subunit [Pseudomonas aeruginosa]MCY0347183.1 terminase small subunit [Pseudomonas aeruginosa]HEJ9974886.1 terminase small subunit [Pseudomonas aeruginosa]HEJ9985925.1 terminase small subunit [Pseudomonas aeruginosa]